MPKSRVPTTEQLAVASYHSLSKFDSNRETQILGSSREDTQNSSKNPPFWFSMTQICPQNLYISL